MQNKKNELITGIKTDKLLIQIFWGRYTYGGKALETFLKKKKISKNHNFFKSKTSLQAKKNQPINIYKHFPYSTY